MESCKANSHTSGRDLEVHVPTLLAQRLDAAGQDRPQYGGSSVPAIRHGAAVLDGMDAKAQGCGWKYHRRTATTRVGETRHETRR